MAKSKSTEVAIEGQFDAENVPTYLAQVKLEKEKLKKEFGEDQITDGNLPDFGNLSEIDTVSGLIQAASSVIDRENLWKEGCKALGIDLKKHPFKLNKWGADKWLNDIKRRVGEVTYKDKVAALERIEIHLEELLDDKHKKQIQLEKLMEEMKKYQY